MTDDVGGTVMYKLGWTSSVFDPSYPYVNAVEDPMSFGFSGYQIVTFE